MGTKALFVYFSVKLTFLLKRDRVLNNKMPCTVSHCGVCEIFVSRFFEKIP